MEVEKIVLSDFSDSDNDCSDTDRADRDAETPPPLSNPPQGHLLFRYEYETLDGFMEDLYKFARLARFSVVKKRASNYVAGFGPTRVDIECA